MDARREVPDGISVAGLYRLLGVVALLWSGVLGGSLAWNIADERDQTLELARNEARANFNKDVAFRQWAAKHGGVYVPTNERTPPNPYLSHIPDRDLETPKGKKLTLMNPAYMLRQMMGEYEELYGVHGRITSLLPLNPINEPDPWEQAALKRFEEGGKEISEVTTYEGAPYLRLMRPLVVQAACLKCHAHQGYEVGDIRGGVGVSVSLSPYLALEADSLRTVVLSHGAIWLLGLGGLVVVGRHGGRRIQAHEQAEQAVHDSETRFRAVFDHAGDAIFVHDQKGRFLDVNRRACESLGYRRDELLGMGILDVEIQPPSDHMDDFLAQLPDNEAVTLSNCMHRRKDGSVFPAEVRLRRVSLGDRVVVVALAHDMSEHRAAQEALERSNAELQQFAYVASHDLQEPLRTVTTYVQLLERRYAADLDDSGRDAMGFVVDASKRMRNLIQDLLAYSRLESHSAEMGLVDGSDALIAALANLESAVEDAEADISRTDLPTVLADEAQLTSVFQNLIGNAIKYRDPERPLLIHVGAEAAGREWMFFIRDNGIGIDPEYADRVFRLFQRLHTHEAVEGTGIGLTLTKKIVERHGGRIWLESEFGKGATFFFTLPRAAAASLLESSGD